MDILEKAAGVRMPPSGGKAEHTVSRAEEKTNDAVLSVPSGESERRINYLLDVDWQKS